jgi:hypothetical protein
MLKVLSTRRWFCVTKYIGSPNARQQYVISTAGQAPPVTPKTSSGGKIDRKLGFIEPRSNNHAKSKNSSPNTIQASTRIAPDIDKAIPETAR